ncbi:hypothetical protein EYF80_016085 [Liparis tanakae]|uniref:Uncharacterized protein n=1 Tax=Liparis tanakae TaxID=230148 RepID=A0A4Z2I8H1_9TELE|nr:hypothetical protein EYF80_016085 [Liparis tanakae]
MSLLEDFCSIPTSSHLDPYSFKFQQLSGPVRHGSAEEKSYYWFTAGALSWPPGNHSTLTTTITSTNSGPVKTPEEFACEMKLYARDTRNIRLKSLDDLKEVMEMNRGQWSDQHVSEDPANRTQDANPWRF